MSNSILFYMHAGSGNHGCEAIVNSLCHMIDTPVVVMSNDKVEDEKYSMPNYCTILQERKFERNRLAHVLYYIYRKITKDKESFIRYRYHQVIGKKKYPLAVSIGGDNYCYDMMLNDLFLTNGAFNHAGTKTVLAGCSIEPELLQRKEIIEDLAKYHTIIARESITYEALVDKYDSNNVKPEIILCPDSAFALGLKEKKHLPEVFNEKEVIGINVSPLIQESEGKAGITLENYSELIRYILETTDYNVALMPHVVWERNDDRKPLKYLHEIFKDSNRVFMIEDGTCEELKYCISKCKLFIGARTHATIAAYSTCVPTLVVGYSVKARGIAKDIFGQWENYVLPVQQLCEKGQLIAAYQWLADNEQSIRSHLQETMPEYCNRAKETGKIIEDIYRKVKED